MEFVSTFELKLKPFVTKAGDTLWTDNPKAFPIDGAIYIPNFLNENEQRKTLEIIDGNPFQQVIRRRQQFYGPTYYHTTHNLSEIQPIEQQNDKHSLDFKQLDFITQKFYDTKCM